MTEPGGAADDVRRPSGVGAPGADPIGAPGPAEVEGLGWTADEPAPRSHRMSEPGALGRFLADTRARVGLGVVAALALGLLVGGLVFGGGGQDAPAAVTALPEPSQPEEAPAPVDPAFQPVATVPEAPRPMKIAIPDLGIDQGLIDLTVSDAGKMGVPSEWMDIGWWAGGPAPGEAGGAVIAGHVNGGGAPAVFAQLPTLAVGAEVVVAREDGSAATYAVRAKEQFPKDDFPDARVYTFEGPSFLHLVTCGGTFDTDSGHYDDNIVVFAELVGVTPA